MHVIAERDLGSPINDLAAVPDGLLVTLTDGRVVVLDDRLATARTLRGKLDDAPIEISRVIGERLVVGSGTYVRVLRAR